MSLRTDAATVLKLGEIWWFWFGQSFFDGFFSSLEIIQGQHMENRTEITKRKDCS